MKRMTALLSAFALTLSLAACGQSGSTSAAESSASAAENPAASETSAPTASGSAGDEKYAEPLTITAVRSLGPAGLTLPEGQDLENNAWATYYQENLNVTISYPWTANDADYTQKMNISITSDNLPDVMWVNAAQLKMMVDNGQAAPLSEVFEQYASEYTKEVFSADGGMALQSATFGGELYAIPEMGTGLQSAQVLWIRSDWLSNLDLEEPKTMDDLLKVAEAFAREDPDQNGQDDTYGLGIMKDLFGSYAALQGFFNGYGAYPDIWVPGEDGSLVYGSTQPEMKTALEVLQGMYADKLLDIEFGVKDASKVSEDVNAGRVGMFFGEFWAGAWIQDAKVKDPSIEWKPIAIPFETDQACAQAPFAITKYTVVNSECKNPEVVIKLLNADLEKMYGKTAEPSVYSIDPNGNNIGQAALVYCEPYKKNFTCAQHVIEAMESGDTSDLTLEEAEYYEKNMNCLSGDYTNMSWHNYLMFGPGGTLTVIDSYDQAGRVMNDQYFGAPTATMSEKKSTLEKLQLTEFTNIIMGAPIENFDAFVENWNALGGEQMTAEVNEWL